MTICYGKLIDILSFFHAQEMKTLIEKLDPEENGRISFDGFCKGIHDFLGK